MRSPFRSNSSQNRVAGIKGGEPSEVLATRRSPEGFSAAEDVRLLSSPGRLQRLWPMHSLPGRLHFPTLGFVALPVEQFHLWFDNWVGCFHNQDRSISDPAKSMLRKSGRKLRRLTCLGAALFASGCGPMYREQLPPFPALPESCSALNKPDIVVSAGQGVRILVGRPGAEPSIVSIAVLLDGQFREDGRIYVPGPDSGFYPYQINNPSFFVPDTGNSRPRHFGASMLWSSAGVIYDRYPVYTTVCLSMNGATVSFYTMRGSEANTVVHFEFYPPRLARPDATGTSVTKPNPESKEK